MTVLPLLLAASIGLSDPASPAAADVALVVQLHKDLSEKRISDEQYTRQLHGIAASIDFSRMTAAEFDQLSQGWFFDVTQIYRRATPRLDQLARRRDGSGLVAACARVRIMPRTEWLAPNAIDLVRAPLVHPGWHPSVDPDSAGLRALATHLHLRTGPKFSAHLLPALEQLATNLLDDTRPVAARVCEKIVRCASRVPGAALRSPTLAVACEKARLKALVAVQAEPSYISDREARESVIAFLKSDLAKLAYFGQPAPAIDVVWTSEPGVRSFEDVRGKVVVLEFWAVTCGPCIAHIPKMEQLKQDVAGEPVAFIAVTGAVQEDLSEPKLPTPEQTAVAAAALKKFMAKKRMTGTVWASAAGSFDPSFGIKSIPHIVVLDAQGRVRASDLSPADPDAIRREIVLASKPLEAKP